MQRVTFDRPWALHGVTATRAIEQAAMSRLPPGTLMQRAGLAVARLALAIAPHARHVWVACGPGNNGGDGLEAAAHLQQWGKAVTVTRAGTQSEPPAAWDLAIDALLGIGSSRPLEGEMRDWAERMNEGGAPVLAIDLPSGDFVRATYTLTLLSLKPSLFSGAGRDAAGELWFDDLGVAVDHASDAVLIAHPPRAMRPHASHKGTWGDVAVIGGAPGMAGAALLAGSGALHGGAGRVYVGLLGDSLAVDGSQPELMLRSWDTLDLSSMSVACGCGGAEAVRPALPKVISTARSLVLDADALNAIAADPQLQSQLQARGRRGKPTVLTPHPLEAARLLARSTADVQADRIASARELSDRYGCVCVLKGSGTAVTAPGEVPRINPTGNARLAAAGTGDVLAGLIAARLAGGDVALDAACGAVFDHGLAADRWEPGTRLTASALARAV